MALILPKSVFVHIPKTGGTWVRRAIEASMGLERDNNEVPIKGESYWGKLAHATAKDLKKQLGNSLEDRLMFSFVRNPADLLKSWYIEKVWPEFIEYDKHDKNIDPEILKQLEEYENKKTPEKRASFKEFVFDKDEGYVTSLYKKFLTSPLGVFPYVDYIGRTENLKEDLIEALEIAGEDFDRSIIENMPPVRKGASLDRAKEVIECDEDTLGFIAKGEEDIYKIFYSNDNYSNLQKYSYDRLASLWSIRKKNFVVGPFHRQNNWEDYNLLFSGMFDFHNNADHLPLAKDCLVLDFGCGPGRNLEKYSSNFKRVDGVDISHINLQNAKEWLNYTKTYKKNKLFKTDGKDLSDIRNNQYDAVMSTITLQHICIYKIRLNLFKEFYRVLKKGGWVTAQMGYGKGKLGAVPYHRDNHNAGRRNGRTDVYVEDPSQLEMDLRNVGFTDFQYWIREPGPGDAHPNWIFFRAKK